jgi:1-acyl-sn-glycerol-3-phosphate acyltransferase
MGIALILLAVAGAMLIGCKLRVLPVPVMRAWFALIIVCNILAMASLTLLIDLTRVAGLASRDTTQYWCCVVCRVTFNLIIVLNPHIAVELDDKSRKLWAGIPRGCAVAINHTSFWDAFLFVGTAPYAYICYTRTLMKSTLRAIPIFGGVFDRVGHFPVYFKSDEDGNFGLDKERQEPVMKRVQAFIDKGGNIALFPEGAVNREPATLKMFRRGSFAIILENKLPLYFVVSCGNEVTWPSWAPFGGYPADIQLSVSKFDIDFAKDDAASVAERLQKAMQAEVDRLRAVAAKKKHVTAPVKKASKKAE